MGFIQKKTLIILIMIVRLFIFSIFLTTNSCSAKVEPDFFIVEQILAKTYCITKARASNLFELFGVFYIKIFLPGLCIYLDKHLGS